MLVPAAMALLGIPVNAATQTWVGDGGSGGNGTWSTSTDWNPNAWVAGNVALFGGTAGTVTVGTQTAGGLTFNVGGYTLQTGTLTLATGSVISTNGGTTTFTGLALAGSGGVSLTKTGAGTLALSTSNTNTLGTAANPAIWTVTGGSFSSANNTFSSILSIGAGNNLGAAPTNATTQVTLDAGTLQITGTGLNPAIGSTRTIQVNAAGGAIVDSTGNPFQGAITDNAGSSSSLYLSNASGTSTFSGVISGGGSLTWSGAGTLAPTATNTYTGGTTISSGTVSVATNATLGATSGVVNLSGGTLSPTASFNGDATTVFAHNVATGTVGGTINVASGIVFSLNYFNNNATGNITGSGPLTKTGAGQLILSGNNGGYSGNWTVSGGLVEVQYNGSTSLGTGSVTLAAGAEMAVNYAKSITNAINSAGGTLSYAVGGGGSYSGAIALTSGTTTVGLRDFYNTSNAESGAISGVISGTGALATSGGGTLALSGANTYGGGTTINSGTVSFSSDANLGADSGAVTLGGGTLSDTGNLSGSASNVFAHNIVTGTVGGTVDVASGATLGLNYYGNNATGNISGSGPLTKTSAGSLILSGNNSGYSGSWTINGGLVEDQNNGSTSLGSGSVTLAAGTELALDYGNTVSNAINSAGGTISYAVGGGGNYSGAIALTAGTTTVGLRDFYNASNAESGTISGIISGTGSLATSGGGTLTLTGASTYTGTTTVGGTGKLEVRNNGSTSGGRLSGTTAINVNNGGTLLLSGAGNADRINNAATINLGGTGTNTVAMAGGATEGSAATVTNGGSPAGTNAFGVGALTLASTATLDFDGASNGNLIVFNGLSGSSTVSVTNWTNTHFDGAMNSGLSTDDRLVFSQSVPTGQFNFGSGAGVGVSEISLGGGYYEVGFTAVPEPSTMLAGAAMLGVVGYRGRRRVGMIWEAFAKGRSAA